jgi:hypothetical protein
VNVFVMLPSGQGATSVKLWRYYVNEWPQAFSSHALGPASVNQNNLPRMTLEHLALSAVGGAVVLAVAWAVRRSMTKPG